MRQIGHLITAVLLGLLTAQAGETYRPIRTAHNSVSAPTAPARTMAAAATTQSSTASEAEPSFGTNFLNIASRETSRQFFNLVYGASDLVPMQWSGNYETGNAGTNSTLYLEAVQRRVNYFRAMAGVPANVTLDPILNAKCQAAAFMMSANNQLNHFPAADWLFYTADGAEAAENSNISLGNTGPQAVSSQMRDNGDNNVSAGHRRWILYPQTQVMGSGNVPSAGTNNAAAALWVFDSHTWEDRPVTRSQFVAWPPTGYVPYLVVYPRWSFSFPQADFSQAEVSMTSNGVAIAVSTEPVEDGYGDNSIVWIPAGHNATSTTTHKRPAADIRYRVTINNVVIANELRSFTYDVNVFDPGPFGPDYVAPNLTGSAAPIVSGNNVYSFNAVPGASRYDFRACEALNVVFTDGAETGVTNFFVDAATNIYNVRESATRFAGSYSFHLAHPVAAPQSLRLERQLLATTNSAVQFRSRLGWASTEQVAKVQVSVNRGATWTDLYTQAGTDSEGETSFTLRTISLAAYSGMNVQVRFEYFFDSGTYYPQVRSDVGWFIDDINLVNCQEIGASTITPANTNLTATFTPSRTGAFLLQVRPVLFGNYPAEWGPVKAATATNALNQVTIKSLQTVAPGVCLIDFSVTAGTPSTFEVWTAGSLGATRSKVTATLYTVVPGQRYRALVASSDARRFFWIKAF